MSSLQYKPFVFIEDIHQTILTSICKYFNNNIQSKKVNEYAYLVTQKSPYKLEKIYLYCLLNEFTEEIYLGFTRNIKKTLKQRTDILQLLGSDGEVVLHSLFILHIENGLVNNLEKFKKTIEKAFINKRFSVFNKDRKVTRKEEIIDELMDKIAGNESIQFSMALESDGLDWEAYKANKNARKELEKVKQESLKKLKNFIDTDFLSQ
ncbi:hypothetical protein [Neobacillus soli]|uniref:hypothetical protein n=1 Tax=Neobacillus soli TaxID=220688 RepID=UPI000824A0A5|nr:hypothetical protein [Neobacillus soli]